MKKQEKYKLQDLTERILKCAYSIHPELGFGFLESVYEKSFCIELDSKRKFK